MRWACRGDGGLVRKGTQSASVTACFDLPPGHPAAGMLAAQDLDEGESLILRRVQFADGKTKAFINDRPVSTALLRELGRKLVEIHGQHDERALLDPSTHRHLLDQFGGLLPDVREVAQLWDRWRELEGKAKELAQALELAERERDYLTAACVELNQLAPQPGEEEALAGRRAVILTSAKVRDDLEAAADALSPPAFQPTKFPAFCAGSNASRTFPKTSGPSWRRLSAS